MKLIQITNTYSGDVLEIAHRCVPEGFEVRTLGSNSHESLVDAVSDADYLLASGRVRIDAEVLAHAEKLKMIQRTGVGLDSLDIAAIESAGIPLYVNRGVNAQSVAEHALLLILACLRNLPQIDANTKSGVWKKQAQGIRTRELSGKTVGIVGMGNIGRLLAKLLKPFGCPVIYTDAVRLAPEMELDLGASYIEAEGLFQQADIISLHCPLVDTTHHLICKETLNSMKDGAVIVNTARGGLICEADLLEALESGKISAAGLDVFEREPVCADNPLLTNPRVITTPHVGGVTYDSFSRMMEAAFGNIALFDAGNLDAIARHRYQG